MSFYGKGSRMLIEQALGKKTLKDCQIAECDLSGLAVRGVLWDHTDMRDLHSNDITIEHTKLEKSAFFRCSCMRALFKEATLDTMVLDGLTLIKSRWNKSSIVNTSIKNVCLQRAAFSGSRFVTSSLVDFEALDMQIENCVFAHCTIAIQYGSGQNGFCGAEIKGCVFDHCRFEGYPLRGAQLSSCVFVHCSGEIGDDMDCTNVAGIGYRGRAGRMPLQKTVDARHLIQQYLPQERRRA
jgi:uncharacterized protein YjbI with pentapeptide repeats